MFYLHGACIKLPMTGTYHQHNYSFISFQPEVKQMGTNTLWHCDIHPDIYHYTIHPDREHNIHSSPYPTFMCVYVHACKCVWKKNIKKV